MKSIRFQLISIISAVIMICLLVMVLVLNYSLNSSAYKEASLTMFEIAESLNNSFSLFIADAQHLAHDIVEQRAMQNAFSDQAEAKIASERMAKYIKGREAYEAIFLFNTQGEIVADSGGEEQTQIGTSVTNQPFFYTVIEQQQLFIQKKVDRSPVSGKLIFFLAMPIKKSGKLLGGVGVVINWDIFVESHIKKAQFGKNGYAYVYDNEMRIIAHPNDKLVLSEREPFIFEKNIRNQKQGEVSYEYLGKNKYIIFVPMPFTGWKAVISAYEDDILSASNNVRNTIIISAIMLILIVSFIVFWALGRFLIEPLNNINSYAHSITEGNFKTELKGNFKYELAILAENIAQMTTALKKRLGFAQGILQGANVPLLVVDVHKNLTFTNSKMLELIGRTGNSQDFKGMNVREFVYNDPNHKSITEVCLQDQKCIEDIEFELENLQGKRLNLKGNAAPIFDLDGNLQGAISLMTDLTEIKRQQQEIENKNYKIAEVASGALDISGQVSSAAEEMAAQIEESSQGSGEQKARMTEALTAIEQMNASIMEVARNASDAASGAEAASETANKGHEYFEQLMLAIQDVASKSGNMSNSLGELGQSAEGIGNIINVINDIADQTNLLALNAAIEAARAGEAGRGFAVVADEVRKLAEKTMQATKEVGQAISSIQDGTRSNIKAMDESGKSVTQAIELAKQANEALEEIVSIAQQNNDRVQSIATASEQQSSASEQIARTAEDVHRIANEADEAMQQSSQAVAELAKLAAELDTLIGRMQES